MDTKGNTNSMTRLGYGMGHVLNDMLVTMWFSYFLLFLHNVIELSNRHAGSIIMIGQVVDGMSSILVGVMSDKEFKLWQYIRYEKRKV